VGAGRTLELVEGDITRQATGAIVNAANSSLLGGGGVDGAIHRAGGPAILEACRAWVAARGRLPTGQAMVTPGGRLPARHVIHTVGPVFRDGRQGEPALLASCYRECLRQADQLGLAEIAFPSISTGAFGYPLELAAPVALFELRAGLARAAHLRLARMVLFDAEALLAYEEAARAEAP
jgi:O-acetyl-ADP-ribose deacetylase (regulator of RNase III)